MPHLLAQDKGKLYYATHGKFLKNFDIVGWKNLFRLHHCEAS
jgi:hypothetical protein